MNPPVSSDVIGTLRLNVLGAFAERFPVVAQRNYSDSGVGARFGQGVLGFSASKPNVVPGKPAIVPGVRSDLNYYSNIGLLNVGESDTTVLLSFLDKKEGQPVATLPVALKPNQSVILQDLLKFFNEQLGRADDQGSIKIEVSTGAVWGFGVVIDKLTRDPEYFPAIPLN